PQAHTPVPLRQRIGEAVAPGLRIVFIALLVILPFYLFQGYSTWTFGLRTQMNQQTAGKEAFFLGEFSEGGWWNYFLVAFCLKTPVGILVLLAAALAAVCRGRPLGRREAVFIVLPVAVYLLALTRLRLNIGLRYALPVYPFLFLLIGHLA